MPSLKPNVADSTGFHRLFARGPSRIVLDAGTVRFEDRDGGVLAETPACLIDAVRESRWLLWRRVTVWTADGQEHAIGGLRGLEARRFAEAVRAEALRRARETEPGLVAIEASLNRILEGNGYVRRSEADPLRAAITDAVRQCRGALARKGLMPRSCEILDRVKPFGNARALERAREQTNDRRAAARVPAVRETARTDLDAPLTEEQAEAVATDEDVTLVLAGAGTGKTAVITGKVAHLVRNEDVPPSRILVLAFNRDAAKEIRARLPDDLADATVSTFHAFGRRVTADTEGTAPTISRLATDRQALAGAVDGILDDLLREPGQSNAVVEFIAYHRAPYRSPFALRTPGEYHEYVRNHELRALSGALVKSFEEMEIANFLSLHGIWFKYEPQYPEPTATPEHRQYKPDFYLPDHEIYIEHFALDEAGDPPPGWARYAEGVEWKRGIHKQYGTRLIETYSWQREKDTLRRHLRTSLEDEGVAVRHVSLQTLVERLARSLSSSQLARLLTTFLQHVKTSGASAGELRTRSRASADRPRTESFLDLFEQVRERYERMLANEKALDFHDLIDRAAKYLRMDRWKTPYRYVLVDEFQDVSAGQMALLTALKRSGVAYFLVGDDWQSVYRFAGSDVRLVRNCGQHLGHVRERTLSRTFRFADGILRPSTAFVQRNPAQTQRPLRAARSKPDDGVTIVADAGHGLERAIEDLQKRAGANGGSAPSVLVLGRYRNSQDALPHPRRSGRLRVEFSTVHSAKGREADYAVVLDLKNERRGFPSQIEDDPLLELVLPPLEGTAYPHAEERRLLYVALTRARRGAYLVADPVHPSPFVEELRHEPGGLRQVGELRADGAPRCPRCLSGRLVGSQSGKTLRCSNQPLCPHQAPRCSGCRAGYAVAAGRGRGAGTCTNPACNRPPRFCDSCGLGVLEERNGRYGRFFGCTEYWSDPPCRRTTNAPR